MKLSMYVALINMILFTLNNASLAGSGKSVPGEYIIKFKGHVDSVSHAHNKIYGKASLKAGYAIPGMYHIKINSNVDEKSSVGSFSSDPDVEYIEPNYIYDKLSYVQDYAPVKVTESWNVVSPLSNTRDKVIVAVIDTGLDTTHKLFQPTSQNGAAALWINPNEIPGNGIDDDHNGYVDDVNGWNFISNANDFTDVEGHGTHVAGIVAGTSTDIYANPIAESKIVIMPLKFIGTGGSTTSLAVSAINYAVNNGAKVINNSWGGTSYSRALHDAFAYAYSHGVVLVNAAGNSSANNSSYEMYPANLDVPSSISVAATDNYDVLASFSDYSPTLVHVAAPGKSIYSTYLAGGTRSMSGTSMASPFVAGVAALMKRESPSLTGFQIKQLLLSSVDVLPNLTGLTASSGRVNALKAINAAQGAVTQAAYQPSYSVKYYDGGASSSSSSTPGFKGGCGLVATLAGRGPGNPDNDLFSSQEVGAVLFLFMLPFAVWYVMYRRVSSKVDNQVNETEGVNRRKHQRFNLESEVRIKVGDKELVGLTKTISMGGLSFNVNEALEKGGIVKLQIRTPDGKDLVEVEGQVVWSEANKAYGVQFMNSPSTIMGLLKQSMGSTS